MDTIEFGRIIKQKYPQYESVPDAELGQRMLEVYPQYQQVVSKSSTPSPTASVQAGKPKKASSTEEFLGGHPILRMLSNAVGTTGLVKAGAQGIYFNFTKSGKDLLKRVSEGKLSWEEAEKVLGPFATNREVLGSAAQTALTAATIGTGAGAKAGGMLGKVGMTKAAGATGKKVLRKTAESAVLGYGADVAGRAANNEENILKPGFGTAVGAVLPGASKAIGAGAKAVGGFTSGVGSDVIQQALNDPDSVSRAVKQYAKTPEAKRSLVDRARAAISDFLQDRNVSYGKSISGLTSKNKLERSVADQSFLQNVKQFGGNLKDGNITFKNSALTSADKSDLKAAWDTLKTWDDTTPQGLDKLRQAISNLMDDFSATRNSRANVVLGKVKKDITQYITQNTDGYGEALGKYGKESQLIRNISKELQITGNAKPTTQLNNILRLFQKDPVIRRDLAKLMGKKEADQFMSEIAGAILSEWLPAGKLGNYFRAAGAATVGAAGGFGPGGAAGLAASAAAASPRIVGKAARTAGKAAKKGVTDIARKATIAGSSKANR